MESKESERKFTVMAFNSDTIHVKATLFMSTDTEVSFWNVINDKKTLIAMFPKNSIFGVFDEEFSTRDKWKSQSVMGAE